MNKIIKTNTLIFIFVAFMFCLSGTLYAQTNTSSVEILWEADSYTPPFYKGKALKSGPSTLSVTAMSHIYNETGSPIDASTLYYKWYLGSRVLGGISGIGQNHVSIATSLRDDTIGVDVLSNDRETTYAKANVIVTNTTPEVLLYYKNPLLGILFNSILSKNFPIKDREAELVAFPLYFDSNNNNSSKLIYTWSINNERVKSGDGENSVIFQKIGEVEDSIISISIKNKENVFQSTKSNFILSLSNEN
ncbi:hypothetical protein COW81_00240 [Candidatus Campbellbacteria bacterium CG22_combo_CG10-13_8_21_14_all_36_13]|uniref:PKD domain-containing protein n=1 Tax=Candidatus Campbellbacteria bacterium CG22_combo_CG10-13_8_21_14_all_36_13 TaxID=1974529 RepID=A0A2H0E0H6_9BACT|nr:MAG: hypothetical protein COW81_00240 [Candidatus Campbellbacteria bacterium CG22_combo_CG10-13_8_21_14_all_36_13]